MFEGHVENEVQPEAAYASNEVGYEFNQSQEVQRDLLETAAQPQHEIQNYEAPNEIHDTPVADELQQHEYNNQAPQMDPTHDNGHHEAAFEAEQPAKPSTFMHSPAPEVNEVVHEDSVQLEQQQPEEAVPEEVSVD